MNLPASRVPWISLAGGAFGVCGMVLLTWYTNSDYPLIMSGKEPFSWQVYVPLFFEMLVLFAALGTFFGMWTMNHLPTFFHPVMQHPMFPQASDDKFLIGFDSDGTASANVVLIPVDGSPPTEIPAPSNSITGSFQRR